MNNLQPIADYGKPDPVTGGSALDPVGPIRPAGGCGMEPDGDGEETRLDRVERDVFDRVKVRRR